MNSKNIVLIILNIVIAAVFVFGGYKFWNAYEAEKRFNEAVKEKREREAVTREKEEVCVQVISYGKNPETNACETFATPCDVPEEWSVCAPSEEAANEVARSVTEEKKEATIVAKEEIAPPKEETTPAPAVEKIAEGGKIYLYYFTGELSNDCASTVKFERALDARYGAEEVAALVTLVKPLTEEEKAQGYYSEIPSGTHLRKLTITKGVATADFNDALNSGGGSCSMTARRAQIENTLLQFPDIKTVVITVNGNAATALQP